MTILPENSAETSPSEKKDKRCPRLVVFISWWLLLQSVALLAVLLLFVVCARGYPAEAADEFLGVVTLLLCTAAFLFLLGFNMLRGSAWTRMVILWVFPISILEALVDGTRVPTLIILMAIQYGIFFYILTQPKAIICFRAQR